MRPGKAGVRRDRMRGRVTASHPTAPAPTSSTRTSSRLRAACWALPPVACSSAVSPSARRSDHCNNSKRYWNADSVRCAATADTLPRSHTHMADFLDEKRKEIQARLKELKPLVDEYNKLVDADQALGGLGNGGASAPASARRRGPGRPAGSGGRRRRGRPKGGGTRAAEALQLVTDRPGITIPELAEAMGIQQNYLYRVMPGLAEEGKVTKSGRGWHLRENA